MEQVNWKSMASHALKWGAFQLREPHWKSGLFNMRSEGVCGEIEERIGDKGIVITRREGRSWKSGPRKPTAIIEPSRKKDSLTKER